MILILPQICLWGSDSPLRNIWSKMIEDRTLAEIIQLPAVMGKSHHNKKDFCILIAIKISMLGRRFLRTINTRIRNNAVKIAYGSTEHWSQLEVLDDGVRNYQLCDDFNDTIDAEFEGHKFKIMKGYDRVLRNIYGDYMQLPPEEQRQPKHSHVKLYWK